PMSQQELADWAGTSADAVGRFLRSWRDRGLVARGERSRRLTVIDLDGLAALSDTASSGTADGGTASSSTGRSHAGPGHTMPAAVRAARPPDGFPPALTDPADWQRAWDDPLNCAIVFTDVAGFSDPLRNDSDRDVVRASLYEILRTAFEASAVPWASCYRDDRGDGAVIVVQPTVSTQRVVDPLTAELADRLRQYNRRASDVVRIQLRVALHVGPVGRDPEGLT